MPDGTPVRDWEWVLRAGYDCAPAPKRGKEEKPKRVSAMAPDVNYRQRKLEGQGLAMYRALKRIAG